ncbi:hypothetical protein FXF51_49315 [Nonomuraea sp. PA05]|uniref:hypothetical protein n=1 Tax=Nonomuraea sp. PA05 TaxID=2604466 RepID=UPI0011D31789|nr:hypothetical protein [Nonomuraea sp. PA05]TYB53461.1 hypothetical protein FXF51_49315 [Nonomuraea sp. PA05]
MTRPDHPTTQRQALRISTVLAGLLNLALAALLAGIPSSSPTLDEVPTPENHAAAPLPAVAVPVQLTASPGRSTTRTRRPATAPTITPARKHSSHRPTATPRPQRSTRTAPARPTLVTAAPTASRRPTPATSSPAEAGEAPKPSSTPEPDAAAQHTPPGQTREPPGQANKENNQDTHTPPGQAKKSEG